MGVGREVSAAVAAVGREREETRMREQYRAAMLVLRSIPSGTGEAALSREQRQAWRDYDAAVAWLSRERES